MKIKMITTAAGPHFRAPAGCEIEVPLELAGKLISGGYATSLEQNKQEETEIETEAVEPAEEKAVKPSPKRKGPKKKPYNRK